MIQITQAEYDEIQAVRAAAEQVQRVTAKIVAAHRMTPDIWCEVARANTVLVRALGVTC